MRKILPAKTQSVNFDPPTHILLHPTSGEPDELFIAPSEIRAFHLEEFDNTHFDGTIVEHIKRTRVYPKTEMRSNTNGVFTMPISAKEGFTVIENPTEIRLMIAGLLGAGERA